MSDVKFMRLALRLARRGYGCTSPNPMVGAVVVKGGKVIGQGWHRKAGELHAEIEALRDARNRGHSTRGTTMFVTLEPCCTHGRTPPCTNAILAAGIKRVVVGTTDPNPRHAGKGLRLLQRSGVEVAATAEAALREACARLNESFNHWIIRRTPFVTVKAAMTLDGKIATASGESKWITSGPARAFSMGLREGNDAIVVGVNTVLLDDPSLTVRLPGTRQPPAPMNRVQASKAQHPGLRRIVLDSMARTPLTARVVSDDPAKLTTIVVSRRAPKSRVAALARRARVLVAPLSKSFLRNSRPAIDLRWLLKRLGSEHVTSLLVEGGGEVNASFLFGGLAQRVVFFYAPKILGGRDARRSVGGEGAASLSEMLQLTGVEWRQLGPDLLLTGLLVPPAPRPA